MATLGILAALATALCWGSYMVPFKRSGSLNLIQFQALMGAGIGLSGLILSFILGYSLTLNPYGLLSGLLWAAGNMVALVAISSLGLSRAAPIAASIIIVSSFLWGVLIFNELPSGLVLGFLGIGLIVLGVVFISKTGQAESKNTIKGLAATILAGLIWGSQLVPVKVGKVATADFFFPVCLGIFVSSLIIFLLRRSRFRKEAIAESFFSGFIWNIGNLLSLISLSIIGLAKSGPISQVALLVAVLWGLFYFKEITSFKVKLQVLIGAVILFLGIIILSLA